MTQREEQEGKLEVGWVASKLTAAAEQDELCDVAYDNSCEEQEEDDVQQQHHQGEAAEQQEGSLCSRLLQQKEDSLKKRVMAQKEKQNTIQEQVESIIKRITQEQEEERIMQQEQQQEDMVLKRMGHQDEQLEGEGKEAIISRMAYLLAVYQNKVRNSKRTISRLKRQKDAQLQTLISQLLVLEAHLRREQKGIVGQLTQRDHLISAQKQEIDRLTRDNRRLINKLKKFSEMCTRTEDTESVEPKLKISRIESWEYERSWTKRGPEQSSAQPPPPPSTGHKRSPPRISVATSVSQLIHGTSSTSLLKHQQPVENRNIRSVASQQPPTVNPNVTYIRATTDRVFHKPPIAEKPRITTATTTAIQGQQTHHKAPQLVRSYGGKQCTILSTISRLLEEESEATMTGGSGSSDASSPEATLKPQTPRVLRLARKFEEGRNLRNVAPHNDPSDSSTKSLRQDDHSSKSYIMDEYEVTSGYNSDAISDHEYENIGLAAERSSDRNSSGLTVQQEEDNYVILRAVKENTDLSSWDDSQDDQHIYSNVEFSSGSVVKQTDRDKKREEPRDREEGSEGPREGLHATPEKRQSKKVLETNIDSLDTSDTDQNMLLESLKAAMNVPRSRHNINLIMESDGDHMTDNFEEFTLDSFDLEEDKQDDEGRGKENLPVSEKRRCGDGAETKLESKTREGQKAEGGKSSEDASSTSPSSNGPYEKFLEATGLSQKSILTPTRMFSNHRSMLKPRDIKHRNKLRAAFSSLSSLEEMTAASSGQRDWTDAYLSAKVQL